jgi:hypothetical protein
MLIRTFHFLNTPTDKGSMVLGSLKRKRLSPFTGIALWLKISDFEIAGFKDLSLC